MDSLTRLSGTGEWLDASSNSLRTDGSIHAQSWTLWGLTLSLATVLLYYLYSSYYAAGLNRYPGPFLAKFGKLWHWLDVWGNRHQLNLVDLHRKHGDVVRIGPTSLSVSNPDYVSKIYGVSAGFLKVCCLRQNRRFKHDTRPRVSSVHYCLDWTLTRSSRICTTFSCPESMGSDSR